MKPEETLTTQLQAFVDILSKLYPVMLEQAGITRLRWGILHLARERAPLTMSELTQLLELPKSNVTYHVDWLENQGYLQRRQSVEDRRVTHLVVTEDGAALVQRVPDELQRRMARLVSEVSPAEVTLMEAGLKLLITRSNLLFDPPTGPTK